MAQDGRRTVTSCGTEDVPVPVRTDPQLITLTVLALMGILLGVGMLLLREEVQRIDPNEQLR